ncbi:MAG: xanthine dehydrogenase family protein subunit M [Deltaproteobacteria bacterium]|nr:xanthine dehydrogenase family protein subunit M [Deltaproteobacteria bacterium]
MEICDFTLHRPTTAAEAVALAFELGAGARFLAGGTDLLVDLKQRRLAATHLIALDGIGELKGITRNGDTLEVGALSTMSDLGDSDAVREHAPGLAQSAMSMGMVQIRNRATIGGNFSAAVPCADTPPICIAAGASVRILGKGGVRTVAAETFFVGPRQTTMQPGELLTAILWPVLRAKSGASYQRFARRRYASLAVAGVAAQLSLDGARIGKARMALASVAPTPLFVPAVSKILDGEKPGAALFAKAARAAADAARPITDMRGSAAYRRDLVETLAMRALEQALANAGQRP